MAEVLQQQWQQLSLLLAEVLSQRDVDLFHLAHQFSALGQGDKGASQTEEHPGFSSGFST
jgi:hypothetical protein